MLPSLMSPPTSMVRIVSPTPDTPSGPRVASDHGGLPEDHLRRRSRHRASERLAGPAARPLPRRRAALGAGADGGDDLHRGQVLLRARRGWSTVRLVALRRQAD